MESIEQIPKMTVFSTDVIPKYPPNVSTQMTLQHSKSLLFNILPIRYKTSMEKSASVDGTAEVDDQSEFTHPPPIRKNKKSMSFGILPFRSKSSGKDIENLSTSPSPSRFVKKTNKKLSARNTSAPLKKSMSENVHFGIEENVYEEETDKIMLKDDFVSSSDDEEADTGFINRSFDMEVNQHAKIYKTFGSNGTTSGQLKDGSSVQYIGKGRCVVADLLKNRLVVYSKSGTKRVILQNEDTIEPWGLALHENVILTTSRRKRLVIKLSQAGNLEESSFGAALFKDPCGIAVTKEHRIIVSDIQLKKVSAYEWGGNWLYDLCTPGNCEDKFKLPRYITVSPLGNIIISDSGNHCIYMFSDQGCFLKTFGSYGVGDGQFKAPYGVCCDQFGNIFVADHYNDRVSFFSKEGDLVCHVVTRDDGIFHPQGISLSPDMKLFVTHGSLKACEVKVFSLSCKSQTTEKDLTVFKV